ncbi:MAG: ABC transporter ATP-binding protein, partial [Clostridiales Family XIII bacterium]|nr:ABC transporter ATP-binding protein [Clostridiales Family XIII bacterium]
MPDGLAGLRPPDPSYRVEGLSFAYPGRESPAIADVSFEIRRGEFVALCGPSGCGKTTLLRQLKPAAAPHGARSGGIFFEGRPLDSLSERDAAAGIGFVTQSPDSQIVTDKVWHELAFGLESLGLKTPEVRLRVAEMASFFGIQGWFYRDVADLSGGQKQLLNLASVMAMQPSVLILDEPTGQLDPIAAGELLAAVAKINRELGVTVVLTEHRLEELLPLCDRAICMDGGRIIADAPPRELGETLRARGHGMFRAMPAPMRIWAAAGGGPPCPVTVREGREWLARAAAEGGGPRQPAARPGRGGPAVEMDDVWFRYGKGLPYVLKGLSFSAFFGEICALLGGNGAGKTTILSLVSGMNIPCQGG